MKAFVDIRTASGLTDSVQLPPAQFLLEFRNTLKMSRALPQPFGQSWLRAVDLDQIHLIFFDERLEACGLQVTFQFSCVADVLCGSHQDTVNLIVWTGRYER